MISARLVLLPQHVQPIAPAVFDLGELNEKFVKESRKPDSTAWEDAHPELTECFETTLHDPVPDGHGVSIANVPVRMALAKQNKTPCTIWHWHWHWH